MSGEINDDRVQQQKNSVAVADDISAEIQEEFRNEEVDFSNFDCSFTYENDDDHGDVDKYSTKIKIRYKARKKTTPAAEYARKTILDTVPENSGIVLHPPLESSDHTSEAPKSKEFEAECDSANLEDIPEPNLVKENNESISINIKKEDVQESKEDPYASWEPMRSHYFSNMNVAMRDGSLPGSAFLGDNTPAWSMELKDIPCKFHDGIHNTCFKENCLMYHPIYGSKDYSMATNEKIRKIPVSYFSQLNAKPMVPKDTIMEVTMEHIKHPWKFYVTSDTDWTCGCEVPQKSFPERMKTKNRLEKELTEYLINDFRYMKTRFSHYTEYQLVAVKRIVKGRALFSRAVVLYDTGNIEDFENPSVHIQLLDNGAKMVVKFSDICNLPAKYVALFPALAFQCTLFGISPVLTQWSSEAEKYFRNRLDGKKCILQVMKSAKRGNEDGPVRLFEGLNSYRVELRLLIPDPVTGKEKYHSVADLLASKFHGVLWSTTPYRSSLLQVIPKEILSGFGRNIHDSKDFKEIRERKLRKETPQTKKNANLGTLVKSFN